MNKVKDPDSRKDACSCNTITTNNTSNNIEFKKITVEEREFCPPEKATLSSSRKGLLLNAEENQKTSNELKTHLNDGFHSLSNFRIKQNEGSGEERRGSEKGNF